MISHLVVLVDRAATSFCYYDNPSFDSDDRELISPSVLEDVVNYATQHALSVNFVYGRDPLPDAHERLIDQVPHVKLVPLALLSRYADAAVVLNSADLGTASTMPDDIGRNVVLRVDAPDVALLPEFVSRLDGKYGRLTLILRRLGEASDDQLEAYGSALNDVGKTLVEKYLSNSAVELNAISDRLMLSRMRNCNPGIEHFTVSHEGGCYLCPAFCYTNDQEYLGGGIPAGPTWTNRRLLSIESSPICRICDAWHCKRCLFLNKKSTLEINTPSRQQCVASHRERDVSRQVREWLVARDRAFGVFQFISHSSTLDPFERLDGERRLRRRVTYPTHESSGPEPNPSNEATERELLLEILRNQAEILALLKSRKAPS
jgi:CXXX repeat peptide maturase